MRLALLVLLLWLPAVAPSADSDAPARQGDLVIVKEGTKEYHRPGCEVIRDGKGVLAMTRAQAEARKFTSHEGCDPAQVKAEEPAATPPGKPGAKPSPKTMVVVDGGRHYHKDGDCKRLGKETKKMTLDEAGRKLWPCPECKPPIRPRPKN
jgi:hypothetical protein